MSETHTPHHARLLLAGVPGGELRCAADMARQSGAMVMQADSIDAALAIARRDGGDLAMVDVELDIDSFLAALRAERIAMPVIAKDRQQRMIDERFGRETQQCLHL